LTIQTYELKNVPHVRSSPMFVIQQTVNTWISDIRARQRAGREIIIIRLNRLGRAQKQIAEIVGISQGRVAQIINNTNFGEINNLLTQGRDMEYIASHYHMDLALTWALRLEGKTDQEKFKELGWGLRTWDQWNFNECDERFGDDWPGRIPAQLGNLGAPFSFAVLGTLDAISIVFHSRSQVIFFTVLQNIII